MTSLLIAASLMLGPGYYPYGNATPVDRAVVVAKGDELQIDRTVTKPVYYQESREVVAKDKDGLPLKRTITVTVCKYVAEKTLFSTKAETTRGFDGAGAKLTADDLKKRLASPTMVLVSFDAQDVDANWFTVLKPETTVLVLPRAPFVQPQPVLPMPIPKPGLPVPPASPSEAEIGLIAQIEKRPSPRPLPDLAGASIDEKGVLHLHTARQHWSSETTMVKVLDEGKEATKNVEIRTTTLTMQRREIPKELVAAVTIDGTKIEPAKLASMLAKPRVVLAAVDGESPDPALSTLFKDDTLVLIPPPMPPPVPMMVPTAPFEGFAPPTAPILPPPPVAPPTKKIEL